jgi:hypothetical protein
LRCSEQKHGIYVKENNNLEGYLSYGDHPGKNPSLAFDDYSISQK